MDTPKHSPSCPSFIHSVSWDSSILFRISSFVLRWWTSYSFTFPFECVVRGPVEVETEQSDSSSLSFLDTPRTHPCLIDARSRPEIHKTALVIQQIVIQADRVALSQHQCLIWSSAFSSSYDRIALPSGIDISYSFRRECRPLSGLRQARIPDRVHQDVNQTSGAGRRSR